MPQQDIGGDVPLTTRPAALTDTKLHQRRHIALDHTTLTVLNTYHQQRQHRAAAVGVIMPADECSHYASTDERPAPPTR